MSSTGAITLIYRWVENASNPHPMRSIDPQLRLRCARSATPNSELRTHVEIGAIFHFPFAIFHSLLAEFNAKQHALRCSQLRAIPVQRDDSHQLPSPGR